MNVACQSRWCLHSCQNNWRICLIFADLTTYKWVSFFGRKSSRLPQVRTLELWFTFSLNHVLHRAHRERTKFRFYNIHSHSIEYTHCVNLQWMSCKKPKEMFPTQVVWQNTSVILQAELSHSSVNLICLKSSLLRRPCNWLTISIRHSVLYWTASLSTSSRFWHR